MRFIRLWFSDILGQLKSFAITIDELEKALQARDEQAKREVAARALRLAVAGVAISDAYSNVVDAGVKEPLYGAQLVRNQTSETIAFFQSGRMPPPRPNRRNLPGTTCVRIFSTVTLNIVSTARLMSVLVISEIKGLVEFLGLTSSGIEKLSSSLTHPPGQNLPSQASYHFLVR